MLRYVSGVCLVDEESYYECLRSAYRACRSDGTTQRVDPSIVPLPDGSPIHRIPVGAWRLGAVGLHGVQVAQLAELDPAALRRSEDIQAYRQDVRRYCAWRQEGRLPPPIEVLQDWDQGLRISNGHRRAAAALLAGVPIRAWVAWVVPTGGYDRDGSPLYARLTWELSAQLRKAPAHGIQQIADAQFIGR